MKFISHYTVLMVTGIAITKQSLTMQGVARRAHLTFSSSLKGQRIPEHEEIDYNYESSNSSSCLDGNEELDDFIYPTENLGTSWGSYLYSRPPTRAGYAHKKLSREAVKEELLSSGVSNANKEKQTPVSFNPARSIQVRSIMETPQPTATSTPSTYHLNLNESHTHKNPHSAIKLPPNNSLLKELEKLMEMVYKSQQDISSNGLNSDQFSLLINVTDKSYSELKKLVSKPKSEDKIEALSTVILLEIIHYLMDLLKAFVQQSCKLRNDADTLQKSGQLLSRNQGRFFKEQSQIQQVIEKARIQLSEEKQKFEEEMAIRQSNMERLQQELSRQAVTKQKPTVGLPKLGTVHEVMQERNQLTALLQTRKEQAKLEKLFIRQQRDIQHIQRDLSNAKVELSSVQDHALKLQHMIVTHNQKGSHQLLRENVSEVPIRNTVKKRKRREDTLLQGILTAQKALDREMLRIKRQLEEQQLQERSVSQQQEASYQSLKKAAVALRKQAAGIKGGSVNGPTDESQHIQPVKHQKNRKTTVPDLPQLEKFSNKDTENKRRKKPTYTFSREELVTLACFSDEEATDNVIEWLELQGNLLDQA